jgi:D-ribose pyranase
MHHHLVSSSRKVIVKKTGLLNQPLSNVIAGMGHNDTLVLADAGLPIPLSVERIDLAVSAGIPAFLDVLRAVLGELQVERAILAEEMRARSPEMHEQILDILHDIPVQYVSHETFKDQSYDAHAIVRTGEFTPYANIILVSGVVF